jgi:hypothetical protein
MKKLLLLYISTICIFQISCNPKDREVMGWAPIYSNPKNPTQIKSSKTVGINTNPGKIYIKDNRFYQINIGKGIHVIDIEDKANPKPIAIIEIEGVQEMSIKGDYLYTNALNDLVIVDIAKLDDVKEIKRLPQTFSIIENNQHPPTTGYYECPEPNKGIVIGWEEKLLKNPKCRK